MNVVRIDDLPIRVAHGGTLRFLASLPEDSHVGLWHGVIRPGGSTNPESHDREEIVLILSGSGFVTIGDERTEIKAGSLIRFPAGICHRVDNTGTDDLSAMIMMSSHIRSFDIEGREIAAPLTAGHPMNPPETSSTCPVT